MPSAQNFGPGISINGTNTVLTVEEAGRYFISYKIKLTAGALVSSTLLINSVAYPASTVTNVLAHDTLEDEVIVSLAAGATIELQLSSALASVTLLGSSEGAEITIIRLA